jgi:hypothetical protein
MALTDTNDKPNHTLIVQVCVALLLKSAHFPEQVCTVVVLHTCIQEAFSLNINWAFLECELEVLPLQPTGFK